MTQQPSLQILNSGAGISGVGQQWKMTDISQASDVTIQGAFGEPMKPTVQGLLGHDKLPAVLVPGMKDNIYSLCQLLQKVTEIVKEALWATDHYQRKIALQKIRSRSTGKEFVPLQKSCRTTDVWYGTHINHYNVCTKHIIKIREQSWS